MAQEINKHYESHISRLQSHVGELRQEIAKMEVQACWNFIITVISVGITIVCVLLTFGVKV